MAVINNVIDFSNLGEQIISEVVLNPQIILSMQK